MIRKHVYGWVRNEAVKAAPDLLERAIATPEQRRVANTSWTVFEARWAPEHEHERGVLAPGAFSKLASTAYKEYCADAERRAELEFEAARLNALPVQHVTPEEIVRRG